MAKPCLPQLWSSLQLAPFLIAFISFCNAQYIPPGICGKADTFYSNASAACQTLYESIGCSLPSEDRMEIAMRLSQCLKKGAVGPFTCNGWIDSGDPLQLLTGTTAFQEWLSDHQNDTNGLPSASGATCSYPAFDFVFANVSRRFVDNVDSACCVVERKEASSRSLLSTSHSVYTATYYGYLTATQTSLVETFTRGRYSTITLTSRSYTQTPTATSTSTRIYTSDVNSAAQSARPAYEDGAVATVAKRNLDYAAELTPMQYVRCTIQKPVEAVRSCVETTVEKLRWIPPGLFLYGGQKSCGKNGAFIIAAAVLSMLFDLLTVAFDWWQYRCDRRKVEERATPQSQRVDPMQPVYNHRENYRQHPYDADAIDEHGGTAPRHPSLWPTQGDIKSKHHLTAVAIPSDTTEDRVLYQFSFTVLLFKLLGALLPPLVWAFALNAQSKVSTFMALSAIGLLIPKAYPLIAVMSPFLFKTKEHGVMVLLADTVISILTWLFVSPLTAASLASPATPPSYPYEVANPPSGVIVPRAAKLFYLGTRIAVAPGQIFMLLFFCIGLLTFAVGVIYGIVCLPFRRSLRTFIPALKGIGLYYLSYLFVPLIPVIAFCECIYKIYAYATQLGPSQKVFPLLRYMRRSLDAEHGSWYAKIARYLGYPLWCALQFVAFVGRWMAWTNLLAVAGEAFCPNKSELGLVSYVVASLTSALLSVLASWLRIGY